MKAVLSEIQLYDATGARHVSLSPDHLLELVQGLLGHILDEGRVLQLQLPGDREDEGGRVQDVHLHLGLSDRQIVFIVALWRHLKGQRRHYVWLQLLIHFHYHLKYVKDIFLSSWCMFILNLRIFMYISLKLVKVHTRTSSQFFQWSCANIYPKTGFLCCIISVLSYKITF